MILSGLLALANCAVPQEVEHPRDLSIPTLAPHAPERPERTELECGTTLLTLPDPRLPLVDGVMLLRGGTALDPQGKTGLVELLVASLRDSGTEALPGPELDRWLSARGATLEFSADPEAVRIEFSCLAEDALELLAIVGDLLEHPQFSEDSIARAKSLMISAFERERDDTSRLADRMLLRAAFGPDSPFARARNVDELKALGREDLAKFHESTFGADRALVGVTGAIDASEWKLAVQAAFDEWKATAEPEAAISPAFLQPRQRVVQVVDRPGITQSELRLTAPGVRRLHADYPALILWSHAVGIGGASNRMMVEVRTERGLAYTVGAYYRAGWSKAGWFEAWCGTRNESLSSALQAVLDVLQRSRTPLPVEELEAVRKRVLNSRLFEIDTPLELLEHDLLIEFYGYPNDFREQLEEKLRTLDAEEISAAVARHLDLERLIIVAVGPAETIEEELSAFGELIQLNAQGESRELELLPEVAALLEKMGGEERWKKLTNLHREGVMTIPTSAGPVEVPRENWQTMTPNQSRTDVLLGGAQTSIVLTPESCFSLSEGGLEDLPADQCRVRRAKSDGNIYRLLHLLARREGLEVSVDSTGRLHVDLDSGLNCALQLGPRGFPSLLETEFEGSTESWEFLEWAEQDGYFWFRRARERNLGTEVRNSSFQPNSELAADLFHDPRK